MLRRSLLCGLLLTLSQASFGDDKAGAKQPKSPANAGFEKMKKLVGTWVAADKDGKPTDQVVSILKLTAGGSAVHETHFPGQPEEMVSLYTVDGPDLIMTHYCVLGNQPRLKADPESSANQIAFKFAGGGNLDPSKDKHMHEVDPHPCRRRSPRAERLRLGKRRTRKGHVPRDEARSEEVRGTSQLSFHVVATHAVATHVSAWFKRDEGPPASGVSPMEPVAAFPADDPSARSDSGADAARRSARDRLNEMPRAHRRASARLHPPHYGPTCQMVYP